MPFVVASRQLRPDTLTKRYGPEHRVVDLTSRGDAPWVRFSPFFPHGGIPVPFSPGVVSASVEGVWQGLKVFESTDVDPKKFAVTSMKGLKRTVRKFGRVRGHRRGVEGSELLSYGDARFEIYLPIYRAVLETHLQAELAQLRELEHGDRTVVLLDYETNCDVANLSKPLSHAGLVKLYLEGRWPGPPGSSPIRYRQGDATQPTGDGPRVIVHVCNNRGGWGRGFVLALSKRWPHPEASYRAWFKANDPPFKLGAVQFVEVEPQLWVANLIGQHGTRRSKGVPPVRYAAIRAGLERVAEFATQHGASVHLPRIGCGLAGGTWTEVEPLLLETLIATEVDVTVYDL